MEVSDLLAGLELDALVAEKVMGYDPSCFVADGKLLDAECEEVPCFSTDISSAWEVVEKLAGYNIATMRICYRSISEAEVECFPENAREFTIYADTAPLAICKAALK